MEYPLQSQNFISYYFFPFKQHFIPFFTVIITLQDTDEGKKPMRRTIDMLFTKSSLENKSKANNLQNGVRII